MKEIKLYKSVLRKLGNIPQMYLMDVDKYLSGLMKKIENPQPTNIATIMAFAGSWSDMEEEDFVDFMEENRNIRTNLFDRKIDL